MARAKKTADKYLVTITANPEYCGIDAGGVQFAHGKAEIADPWLAEWFRTHEGYEVTPVDAPKADAAEPVE